LSVSYSFLLPVACYLLPVACLIGDMMPSMAGMPVALQEKEKAIRRFIRIRHSLESGVILPQGRETRNE